ncbi:MAG: glucans biosynthesis glucosyltransferase MdoH, partial [Aquisalimonadaceae bacterium]
MSFEPLTSEINSRRATRESRAAVPGSLPLTRLRLLLFFGLVLATTVVGVGMMFHLLRANGMTFLQVVVLVLFAITFAWIAVSFWTGLVGFLFQVLRLDPLTLRRQTGYGRHAVLTSRTVLAMPIYNENPARVMAGLEATCHSLLSTGQAHAFDAFILSDTTDPDLGRAEEQAVASLRVSLPEDIGLYYRRRSKNIGRKAGNIADFCRRWGRHYDFMVVLDADSVMSGATLVELVRSMEANPRTGMIQTPPVAVRQQTPFGRFLQFAGSLYGPMLATGLSFWQANAANYWGHNAIIRVRAFTDHCGLPVLPGVPPLGGEILSHDFVEAALMRRAGWDVWLRSDLEGSYEELPGNLLDYAKRDRRWTQGNLQHLRLLGSRGLRSLNRLHFVLGALAYLSSLLWLLMLAVSTADAMVRAASVERFFGTGYQLFPDWPVARPGLGFSLLAMTLAMLLLPKVLAILLTLMRRRHLFGGGLRLVISGLLEVIFSILIAPVMMAFHSWFVISVLLGRNTGWGPQVREGRAVPWREALRCTGGATLVSLIWGGMAAYLALQFFWWLTPVLVGLILAAPIVRLSSSLRLGSLMRRWGLLLVPSEVAPDALLQHVSERDGVPYLPGADGACVPEPPPELPRSMPSHPLQSLDRRVS